MTEHNSERSDRLHTERLTVANWDRLRRLERVSTKLDSQFRLPVVGGRFGWDSVIGLVPGLGDIATTLPSLFMIYEATRIGARRRTLVRMTANTAADFAIGSIHVAGDIFDVYFKSHRRNVALLRREMERQPPHVARDSRR